MEDENIEYTVFVGKYNLQVMMDVYHRLLQEAGVESQVKYFRVSGKYETVLSYPDIGEQNQFTISLSKWGFLNVMLNLDFQEKSVILAEDDLARVVDDVLSKEVIENGI